MAARALLSSQISTPSSVKQFVDSAGFAVWKLPSHFAPRDPDEQPELEPVIIEEEEIPEIDLDTLNDASPDERFREVQKLANACKEWGFFMVVNHGLPKSLTDAILLASMDFFGLPEVEKNKYVGEHVLDPIRYGSSVNTSLEQVHYWRDFLKVFVHPHFHCPDNPPIFREIVMQYTSRSREVALELLKVIWESLDLDESHVLEALGMDSCFQIFIANLYPPYPEPNRTFGLPEHSDHGLLTVLLQNRVNGLQVWHRDKWVRIKPHPDALLVNLGDHVEIVSNGKYKSILHRAEVNATETRLSIVALVGPSLDAIVEPAQPSAKSGSRCQPAFRPMRYREYMEYQQSNQIKGKTALNLIRL